MPSPHAPRAASRDLLASGLALLAAALLTGCSKGLEALDDIFDIIHALIILWTIFVLVLMAGALLILIISTRRLTSGRPSIAWGTTAFVLGSVGLSVINIGTPSITVVLARRDLITLAALFIGIGLVLVGGLNIFLVLHRKSQAAARARLGQEDDAEPAKAEQEPPKLS